MKTTIILCAVMALSSCQSLTPKQEQAIAAGAAAAITAAADGKQVKQVALRGVAAGISTLATP